MKTNLKNRLFTRSSVLRMAFPCAVTLSLLASSAHAAAAVWDGLAGSPGNWDADNWSGGGGTGGAPVANDILSFGGNVQTSAFNNFTAATQFNGINFTNNGTGGATDAAFSLTGASITLGGNIVATSSTAAIQDTIGNDLLIGASRLVTAAGNHTIALTGAITINGPNNTSLTVNHAAALSGAGGTINLNSVNASIIYNNNTDNAPLTLSRAINATFGSHLYNNSTSTAASLIYNGTFAINTNTFVLNGTNTGANDFQSPIGGSAILLKNSAGSWTVSGLMSSTNGVSGVTGNLTLSNNNNTYTGSTLVTAGTLNIATIADYGSASAVGKGTSGTALRLGNNNTSGILNYTGAGSSTNRTILIGAGTVNTHTGGATIQNNGSNGGTGLKFTALTSSTAFNPTIASTTANRTLTLGGTNTDANEIQGMIQNNTATTGLVAVTKANAGTWFLAGANTYTGATSVNGGTLVAMNASALGTSATANVSLAAGTALNYAATTDANLAIGGNLTITSGTNTTIGGSIGSTPTNGRINVAGNATTAAGAVKVNITGIPGVNAATGTNTYTLVHGQNSAGGSSSMDVATYSLGAIHNNTSFTVGALSSDANDLKVAITSVTPLSTAFWMGGLSGASNVWAASDGATTSNWKAAAGGAIQELVPGFTTDVTVSATSPTTAPTATVLGANMSIQSLTIADTTNGLGLNADGYTLATGTGGITMNATVPASTLAAKVNLGAPQVWTNNSSNLLTVSGAVTAGANLLTFAGSGNTTLSGSSVTTSGGFTVNSGAGTVTITAPVSLGAAQNWTNNSTTPLTVSGVVSGALFNITIGGTGTVELSGTNTYTGQNLIDAGTLSVNAIANTGTASAVGAGTAAIRLGSGATSGILNYTGGGNSSNRQFQLGSAAAVSGTNGAGTIQNNGTGALVFTYATFNAPQTFTGAATGVLDRTLTLGGANTNANTIQGAIQNNLIGTATGSAAVGVTKANAGTWVLTGINTYSGNTTVNAGTLTLSIASAPANANTGNDASAVTIASSGATLNLTYTGTDIVDKLFIGSDQKAPGVYGKSGSILPIIGIPQITGDGTLTVNSGPASNNYASWANDPTKGNIPGEPATGDFDNDGLSNIVEYALGKNPRISDQPAGVLSGNTITFTKGPDAIAYGDVSWVIETSSTLANDWAPAATQPAGDPALTISHTFTPGTPDKKFARLKVTQN